MESISATLPLSRDLTSAEEAARVLSIADDIIKSRQPLQELKDRYYGSADTPPGPAIMVSAIGSAESKIKLSALGPLHMTCIFAMYGEKNRIKPKSEHPNGQDFIRMKVQQLEWLFRGEEGKSWELLAVDDGDPDVSSPVVGECCGVTRGIACMTYRTAKR